MAEPEAPSPRRGALKQTLDTLRTSGPLWTASVILDRLAPVGVLRLWSDKTVSADILRSQIQTILAGWGMPADHVETATRHILYADLHGIDSHGCSMLLHYHRLLTAGTLNPAARVEIVSQTDTTALLDGGSGLGHVPADTAMQLAIAKCRTTGLSAVAVRNSGHFGAAASYVSMATASGFIGIATTNAVPPAIVPTHGTEARLGTNPIAFSAPASRNRPFLLDMSTATAPIGKLTMAARKSRAIPSGWALDPEGRPVTNARNAALHRRLTPLGSNEAMGSHKGYGLATALEILSGVLPGGTSIGHFFLVLDPERFRPRGEFENDLDGLIDTLHATARKDPNQPVLVAGDPEHNTFVERTRAGIPLSRSVIEDIRGVARASRVDFVLDQ